jgi:hypothetical protein
MGTRTSHLPAWCVPGQQEPQVPNPKSPHDTCVLLAPGVSRQHAATQVLQSQPFVSVHTPAGGAGSGATSAAAVGADHLSQNPSPVKLLLFLAGAWPGSGLFGSRIRCRSVKHTVKRAVRGGKPRAVRVAVR